MKKWRIEFTHTYPVTPLSYWVHKQLDHEVWHSASRFEPGLSKAIPCKGFPLLLVNVSGVELRFASIAEVEHFLAVIGQKNMPTPLQLSRQRSASRGPNSHWLSRLPACIKPWSKRVRIIPVVERALFEFSKVVRG